MMNFRLLLLWFVVPFAGGCGGTVYSSRDASIEDRGKKDPAAQATPAEAKIHQDFPSPQTPPAASEPQRIQTGKAPISEPVEEPSLPAPSLAPGPKTNDSAAVKVLPEPSTAPPVPRQAAGRSREAALKAIGNVRPEVAVRTTADGEPVVQVRYPWYELPRPSVQIGRAEETSGTAPEPMTLDGAAADELIRKQIERLNKPIYPSSEERVTTAEDFLDQGNGNLITLRGRINLLGKESAYVVDERTGTPVVVYQLDRWADDQRTLFFAVGDFDRTRKFDAPGKLHVWLLSEEQVVWTETVDWPGVKAQPPVVHQPAGEPQPSTGLPQPAVTQPQAPAGIAGPNVPDSPAGAPATIPQVPQFPEFSATNPPVPAQPEPMGKTAEPSIQPPVPAESPPGWKQVESKTPQPSPAAAPEPSPAIAPQPSPAAAPQSPPAKTPPAAAGPTYAEMSVDQLARHIEEEFRSKMSPEVRRLWVNGYRYYFVVNNPPEVRRTIFMDMLRSAYAEKPSPELAEAFKFLYHKLKAGA